MKLVTLFGNLYCCLLFYEVSSSLLERRFLKFYEVQLTVVFLSTAICVHDLEYFASRSIFMVPIPAVFSSAVFFRFSLVVIHARTLASMYAVLQKQPLNDRAVLEPEVHVVYSDITVNLCKELSSWVIYISNTQSVTYLIIQETSVETDGSTPVMSKLLQLFSLRYADVCNDFRSLFIVALCHDWVNTNFLVHK